MIYIYKNQASRQIIMKRRQFLNSAVASAAGLATIPLQAKTQFSAVAKHPKILKNNIHHAVCHWCYSNIPLEEFLISIKKIGITAVDLMGPNEWPLLKKHGIYSSMCNGAEISLTEGWNDPQHHCQLIENYSTLIPEVAAAGYTNLICFSGNRNGMSDTQGLANCIKGLKQIMPLAEKQGIVIQMELFNQQNHPDYMCDSTAWGVALCQGLGSENFKLLYDIYHMQVQEGDIIKTIRDHHTYLGHYHTAGVPGRNEIDERQELYYPAIMKAILETGYLGYVAQEFVPKDKDVMASLKKAIEICDV